VRSLCCPLWGTALAREPTIYAWGLRGRVMLALIDVLKWPVVFLICFFTAITIFRSAISTLFSRAQRAGFGNKSIDFSPAPAEQQKALEAPSNTAVPTVPADTVRPPPMAIYTGLENEIKAALEKAKYPLELQNAWLLRAVAMNRVMRDHEIVYRLILGSQVNFLLEANAAPLPDMARAHQIFDDAKARFPDIYTNFSFDTWFHFLLNAKLVQATAVGVAQVLRITSLGQDFLRYLVDNGLTSAKVG
jgi:hypothetical protein